MPSNEILSSTSQDEIISKATYRFKVWNLLENKDLVRFPRPCKGRIPNFVDNMVAAERLAAEDIFKNAQVIKVNIDKPQELVRYNVLESGKTLLVASTRLAEGFLVNVSPPPDSNQFRLREACKQRGAFKFSKPLSLDDKIHVDMVVVGSVAVSKQGHRIGKGEGFSDLEFAMMASCGMITEKTVIVTTAHDEQVFDTLPHELFQPFDVPVDFIITPSRVIEVNPRLPRPAGLLWHILSDRRMQNIPVLKTMRNKEMESGNECKLKEVDSEPEDRPRPYFLQQLRRPYFRRRPQQNANGSVSPTRERNRNTRTYRRTRNPTQPRQSGSVDDELQNESRDRQSNAPRRNGYRQSNARQNGDRQSNAPRQNGDRQSNAPRQIGDRQSNAPRQTGDRPRQKGSVDRRPNRRLASSGDRQPGANGYLRRRDQKIRRPDSRNSEQNTDGENKENSQNHPLRRPMRRNRFNRNKLPVDFSVKVGNISSTVRVRDLKAALQEKGVHPRDITWRGPKGFAYLHFAKLKEQPEQPTAVDDVIASLRDLTVKFQDNEGSSTEALLSVEPAKPISRIENAGVTAV